jgi:hypothetical protein
VEDKHHSLEVGSAICQTPHPTPMDQRSERVNLDERPTGHRCETSIVHDDEHDRTKQGTGVQVMYCLSFMIVRNRRTLWAYASRPVASHWRTAAQHCVVTVSSARRAATDRSVPPELLTSSHSENCGGCRPCVRAVVPRSRPNLCPTLNPAAVVEPGYSSPSPWLLLDLCCPRSAHPATQLF